MNEPYPAESPGPRRRPRGTLRLALGVLVVVGLIGAAALFRSGAQSLGELGDVRITEERIRELVSVTLQREAEESFLLTGRLDVTTTSEVENTRRVLPGVLDLSLGTSRATVRVPGHVYYGIDLRGFDAAQVSLVGDSIVQVRLPAPTVKAVEPLLAQMQVRTERGWARLPAYSERDAERRAIRLLTGVLRSQGEAHLADAHQPRVNTANAVERFLRPALAASGLGEATFQLTVGGATFTRAGTDAGDTRTTGGGSL